jgi:hypothetical protein
VAASRSGAGCNRRPTATATCQDVNFAFLDEVEIAVPRGGHSHCRSGYAGVIANAVIQLDPRNVVIASRPSGVDRASSPVRHGGYCVGACSLYRVIASADAVCRPWRRQRVDGSCEAVSDRAGDAAAATAT